MLTVDTTNENLMSETEFKEASIIDVCDRLRACYTTDELIELYEAIVFELIEELVIPECKDTFETINKDSHLKTIQTAEQQTHILNKAISKRFKAIVADEIVRHHPYNPNLP